MANCFFSVQKNHLLILNTYLQHLLQQSLVMSFENDVMVANGIGKEIVGQVLVAKPHNKLGAAQTWTCLTPKQFTFSNERPGKIARHFEQSDRTFFNKSPDTNANTRLKMGVKFKMLHHIERNGAMSKHDFPIVNINAGRVRLESR